MTEDVNSVKIESNKRDELESYLINKLNIKKSKEQLKEYSNKDLIFMIKWFVESNKKQLCEAIKDLFTKEDRIINDS